LHDDGPFGCANVPPPSPAAFLHGHFKKRKLIDIAVQENFPTQTLVVPNTKRYAAARAIGLDCGPVSGFDNEAVDREFFPGGQIKSNFICAIGYGDPAGLLERLPRPDINEVCSFV
jgi:nitroreductase